jgi:hypothetical protein
VGINHQDETSTFMHPGQIDQNECSIDLMKQIFAKKMEKNEQQIKITILKFVPPLGRITSSRLNSISTTSSNIKKSIFSSLSMNDTHASILNMISFHIDEISIIE